MKNIFRKRRSSLLDVPAISATKETERHPMFRSYFMRVVWRFYCWQLTPAGRWFFWPSVALAAYGSTSLENQTFQPMTYVFVLWLLSLLVMIFLRPAVALTAAVPERVCAGERMVVDVEVKRTGWLAWMELNVLPHRLPPEIDAESDDGVDLPPLRRGASTRAQLGLRCRKRGTYRLKAFAVGTDFPFGMVRAYRVFWRERPLLVYPYFSPLARMELPVGRRYQPGGVALASITGDSVEFIGDREYREGDNIRDIDWRATARLNRLVVREYRQEYFLRVAVILDTHVPAGAPDGRKESFEQAVSLTAAVGDYCARQDYIVDIFAAGPNLYHLAAGRSLAYLDQILDILACVEANPNEPFEIIEPELAENLSRISSIVCIFLDWTESRRSFVHRLRQQGVGIKAVIVTDSRCALDPAIDGWPVYGSQEFKARIEEI